MLDIQNTTGEKVTRTGRAGLPRQSRLADRTEHRTSYGSFLPLSLRNMSGGSLAFRVRKEGPRRRYARGDHGMTFTNFEVYC